MSERPTPETDAMCICTHYKSFKAIGGVVNPDFARRLERERDEARTQLASERALADRLAKALLSFCSSGMVWPNTDTPEKAIAAWKEARSE